MARHEGPFDTRIRWIVKVQEDRGVRHELEVDISNIKPRTPTIPQRISIPFEPWRSIEEIETIANGQVCRDSFISSKDGKKTYHCDLAEIASKYGDGIRDPMSVRVSFPEKNAIKQVGPISLASLFYDCNALKAYDIHVKVFLPRINVRSYLRRKLFSACKQKGVYQIYAVEASKAVKWYERKGDRQPELSFVNLTTSNAFPEIMFGYQLTGDFRVWPLIVNLLLWIFSCIVSLALGVLGKYPQVEEVFVKLAKLLGY